jgi:hypothetical protein
MVGLVAKSRSAGLLYCTVMLSALLVGSEAQSGMTIKAASASRADVGTAVSAAKDGDTVIIPAGSATWDATLNVTKNISLIGAGEGQTVITTDVPEVIQTIRRKGLAVSNSHPVINVSLSHESAAPGYSFRLSGLTLRSANTTKQASEHPYIRLVGQSNPATSPAPYVLGCVSRVRLDHITWDKLNGLALIIDSCLGVADHITIDSGTRHGPPIKVYMNHWTPAVYDANGTITPVTMTKLATNAYGSWADDPYFGTDKFWFFEDCSFTVATNTNACDNEKGARVVFRHCTVNGGSIASHGMEGAVAPGIRVQEVYNNYFNFSGKSLAQTRSGTILWFNNLSSSATPTGWPFQDYRATQVMNNWGAADGTNRYDDNAGGPPLYTGTITSTAGDQLSSITDSARTDFSLINLTDGTTYSVNDLDQAANTSYGGPPESADPGWKYKHASVASVSGKTLTLTWSWESGDAGNNWSPKWVVGDHYEVRKINAVWGQIGRGKGNLLNIGGRGLGAYETYNWPATSGTKATFPQAGYPLEPAYSWNNYNVSSGSYLNFSPSNSKTILPNRDYFDKGHITPETTEKVGYPGQDYTHATTNYPGIGPTGRTPYKPYIYPHPLNRTDGAHPGRDGAPSGSGSSKPH